MVIFAPTKGKEMRKNSVVIESIKGETNEVVLSKETVLHVGMKEDSVLYVRTKLSSQDEKKTTYKQIWLSDLINNYKGPSIYLDFNDEEELVGIEILGD